MLRSASFSLIFKNSEIAACCLAENFSSEITKTTFEFAGSELFSNSKNKNPQVRALERDAAFYIFFNVIEIFFFSKKAENLLYFSSHKKMLPK